MIIKFEATCCVTGKDIIEFIQKNHLEDKAAYKTHEEDGTCARVYEINYEEGSSTFLFD